ncbi:hypothetical protein GCM10027425_32280 [Alteromonas gracilis]
MGKPSNDRRAAARKALEAQRSSERRRNLIFGAVIAVVVVGLLSAALVPYLRDQRERTAAEAAALADFGVPAAQASCDPQTTEAATGGGRHLAQGTPIPYGDTPPAFGPHYPEWAAFDRKFYDAEDRPALGNLVHNLEHGYNVIWYAEDLPEADVDELRRLSTKFEGSNANEDMVIVAPWTSEDGQMPEGKQIAMTHWSADPQSPQDEASQEGVWQYCGEVSGEAIGTFLEANPWTNAPEPGVQ